MAAPTVDSIEPTEGQNDNDIDVTIKGKDFTNTSTIKFNYGTSSINATDITFVSSTELKAKCPKATKAGKYDVIVANATDEGKLADGFEVKAPPPVCCITAGGQIYLEWKSDDYNTPKKYNIYRDNSKVDTVNDGDNETDGGKQYWVDLKSSDGNKYKYKIQAESTGNKKSESNETAEINVNVFDTTQDSELHFFGDDDTETASVNAANLIAKFISGPLDDWCLLKAYMCKEADGFYIYSVDPDHRSTGGKKNEIDEVEKKTEGDTGAGNIPHKKGIHTCDTKCFGDEHNSDKKTSILIYPIKGGTLGFYWQVHEKAPPNKAMSKVGSATEVGTSNRKMLWVTNGGAVISKYSTVAHEFQHLIYWGHDQKTDKSVTWINEGLSVYSVDLNNYWKTNNTYESRLNNFKGMYKNNYNLSPLRLTDTEWDARSANDVQFAYASSGIWTLYIARRFPGKIDDYGKAKGDHKDKVFKQSTVSSNANDKYENIFTEWAFANYFNKHIVDIKKNAQAIKLISDISNFSTDVDAGKYNYYVQVDYPDIKDGANSLKVPNTDLIRELVVDIDTGIILPDVQKSAPVTPLTDLDILKSSVRYLKFDVNASAAENKRLHIFIKNTGKMIKMYTIESSSDGKACFVNETKPKSKKINFSSHTNQKDVVAILPNHTKATISTKYLAYYTDKPKIEKVIYSQKKMQDQETLAADKATTMELEKGTDVTIKIVFDQEMTKEDGNYTFKEGDKLEDLAKKYYGKEDKKDQIKSPVDPPVAGTILEFPMKLWYIYEGEAKEKEFSSAKWSKTAIKNDTLSVKCKLDSKKKDKKVTIYICCAANFAKDIMLMEDKYNFKVKVSNPSFTPQANN